MKILRRYFFKEFFKYFVLILVGFTTMSIVAEFFDKVSEFYSYKPTTSVVVQYLLLQTPAVILYALPFASLFSILITIGTASKWKEIVVIKAAGGSTKKMFAGYLSMGMIFTLTALILGETLVPRATEMAAWIRKVRILKEEPRVLYRKESLWLKGLDKSLIRIDGFVMEENRILKTSLFYFSPSFGLEKRIEADEAVWTNGEWTLKNVTVFDFTGNTITRHGSLISAAIEEPRIFSEDMKKPQEMNFAELYAYYTRLEKAGFKNLKYVVRLYEKISYPVINFIMVLFGVSLSLHSRWGGGIKAAGIGVIASAVYWLIYAISISLGNAGVLPPQLAPWIGPIIFGIAGGVMYMRIRD